MSEIEEAVAKAISQKQLDEGDGLYDWYALTDEVADGYRDLARAAIEAYEKATAEQEMHDQRAIWEAVERMKFTPADTPLMDALKSGRLYK